MLITENHTIDTLDDVSGTLRSEIIEMATLTRR